MADKKKEKKVYKRKDEKKRESAESTSRDKKKEKIELNAKSNAKEVHRVLPLVFGLLAFLLFVVLFLNLLCNAGNRLASAPSNHWMGVFGYYVSYGLLGVFGHTAILLPLLLLNAAIFWRRWVNRKVHAWKSILSLLFLLLADILLHIIYLSAKAPTLPALSARELISLGNSSYAGGFVGGELGYRMVKLTNFAGGYILTIVSLIVVTCLLWDLSPMRLFQYIKLKKDLHSEKAPAVSEQEAESAGYRAKMNKKVTSLTVKEQEDDGNLPPQDAVTPDPASAPDEKNEKLAPMPMPKLRVSVEEDEDDGLYIPDMPVSPEPSAAPADAAEEELLDVSDPGQANLDSAVDPIFPRIQEGKGSKKGKVVDPFDPFICFPEEEEPEKEEHKPLPPEVPLEAGNVDPASMQSVFDAEEELESTDTPADAPDADAFGTPVFRRADADPLPKLMDNSAVPDTRAEPEEKPYVFPPVSYLHVSEAMTEENEDEIHQTMLDLAQTFKDFKVGVQEINYSCGPTVTRYEVTPAPGVRVRAITGLSDDIALSLATSGVRMESNIPGKNAVGVEVPNKHRSTVYLRTLIESDLFTESKSKLTSGLGMDIAGNPVVFDIASMPHLLIAGTTGSGKSVCINGIILSLLYKARPDEVKLVLIDPKKVEFSTYRNIPHLLAPIVTTPKDAAGALRAAVEEMERRFELFSEVEVLNLKGYNSVTKDDPERPFLPQIVIIIDELADLMMTAPADVEDAICRIAQKARAAGIHLIVGTQRPSVDVVTGLIKSNIPSRIAFTVSSQVDSRTILDTIGAEKLTGKGDMLFSPIGATHAARIQGAFVSDDEIRRICDFVRNSNGLANYDENFINKLKELAASCGVKKGQTAPTPGEGELGGDSDAKYSDAVRIAVEEKKISTSLLQRKLQIGYSRAAKLIDRMQEEGIVSAADGSKPRSILITPEDYLDRFVNVITETPPEEE